MGKVFERWYFLVRIFCVAFYFVPCFFRRIIWSLFSPFDGYFSVLVRYAILRVSCKSVGRNVYVGPYVVIKNAGELTLGSNVSIHAFCYIDSAGGVLIADNVSIAHGSSVISFEHTWFDKSLPIKYNKTFYNEVIVSKDVWIGCGVRVLAGTHIEERSVIAAGAVVKGVVLTNSLYGGVPARRLKGI